MSSMPPQVTGSAWRDQSLQILISVSWVQEEVPTIIWKDETVLILFKDDYSNI